MQTQQDLDFRFDRDLYFQMTEMTEMTEMAKMTETTKNEKKNYTK